VDVKLSAMKTGKISIYRGDDPYELASGFARIYSLDSKARDLLVTVIYQSMEQNGLLVPQGYRHDNEGDDGLSQDGHGLQHGFASDREMQLHLERERDWERDFGRSEFPSSGGGAEGSGGGPGTSGTPEEDFQSGSSVSGSLDDSDISADESLGSGSDGEGSDRDSENLTA